MRRIMLQLRCTAGTLTQRGGAQWLSLRCVEGALIFKFASRGPQACAGSCGELEREASLLLLGMCEVLPTPIPISLPTAAMV